MLPALKGLYHEKGTLGILEWIYDKKRFLPIKIILKSIFLIFPYETILKVISQYNNDIPSHGFAQSTRTYLNRLRIKTNLHSPLEVQGGALFFGNHPTGLDPFILASCLNREDVYIVADVYQQDKGKNIGQHIIPVLYSRTRKNLHNRGFLNSIGFYVMRLLTGYIAPDEVKDRNKAAIQKAADLLKNGHIVIIFPDGGSNNPELWYNGIGEIITQSNVTNNRISLYAAHINDITTAKLIRHFLFNSCSYFEQHPLHIEISQPLTLEQLHIKDQAKSSEITERLRTEFLTNKLWIPNYVYNRSEIN